MRKIVVFLVLLTLSSLFIGKIGLAQAPQLDRPPMEGEAKPAPQMRPIPASVLLSPVTILRLMTEDAEIRNGAKITDQQVEDLKKLLLDMGRQQQAIRQKYGTGTLAKETEAEMRREQQELQSKLMPGIADILTREQMMQFYSMHYLILGGADSPMMSLEMLAFLNLDEEQQTKIRDIMKRRAQEIAEKIKKIQEENAGQKSAAEISPLIVAQGREISRRYGEEIRAAWTPEQRKIEEDLEKTKPALIQKFQQFLRRLTTPRTP